MTTQALVSEIKKKQSFLCIGLDVDLTKIPPHLLELDDPIFEFNKAIIKATHHLCVAYKPNIAFYEAYGLKGWKSLEKTIEYMNENHPEIFTIADAKRGDIGNTSSMYAKVSNHFFCIMLNRLNSVLRIDKNSLPSLLQFSKRLQFISSFLVSNLMLFA
jgi:orotidine-5'-phosphate decarboxylase